jgi:hypothetical protein
MTSSVFEPATFRLVAQSLNHYTTDIRLKYTAILSLVPPTRKLAQAITLLARIHEVNGSVLDRDTKYLE